MLIALVNAFIYLRLKYRDEGFEMVQWNEFITVHVTFPVLNAWCSYTLVYILFLNIVNLCDYQRTITTFENNNQGYMPGNDTNWNDINWFCRSPELET